LHTAWRTFSFIGSLFLCAAFASEQSAQKEPSAVVELGAAAEGSITEGQSSFGPTVAVEVTPIEKWLELGGGVTPLFRRHSTEWGVDLPFKKPWTFSDKFEFMIGVGPEWIHTNAYGIRTNSVGAEVAPDLMFWSSKKHRVGWYLEPSYEYKFGTRHEHSGCERRSPDRDFLKDFHPPMRRFCIDDGRRFRNVSPFHARGVETNQAGSPQPLVPTTASRPASGFSGPELFGNNRRRLPQAWVYPRLSHFLVCT
jgi:hypothetical protein